MALGGPLLGAQRIITAVRSFHGWRIVGGAMGLQLILAALFHQGYGAYAPFWMAEFGWSRTTVALAFSLHRTESALLGPIHGWLLQRFSPSAIVLVGALVLGCGFLVLSRVTDLTQFIVVFLLMAIGASFMGVLSVMTVIVNWFRRRRATALSMMHLGFSLGGLAVPILALGLEGLGWRTIAVFSGLIVLAAGIPISRLLVREPEAMGLTPDGDVAAGESVSSGAAAARAGVSPESSLSVREALLTRPFWLISGGHAAALTVASSMMVHFVVYVHEVVGLSVTLAAGLVAVMTGMSLVGQIVGGVVGDRVDKRWLAGSSMLGHGGAMVLLALAPSAPVVAAAAALHGLSVGVRGPMMGALKAEFFGRKIFAAVSGFASMVVALGSIAGPVMVGMIADATGEYGGAFWVLAALATVGCLAFLGLPRPGAAHQRAS